VPRACTVCTSPAHALVDTELAGGTPLAVVARRHRLSSDAVRRHREAHLSPALRKLSLEKVRAESAEGAFGATVDRLEGLIGRLEALLSVAEERKSLIGGATLAREIRGALELVARLRHELDDRPQNVTVNVLASAEFTRAVTAILAATEAFPEARVRIADALDELDALPVGVGA